MRRSLLPVLVSLVAVAVLGLAATVASAATVRDKSGAVVGSVRGAESGHVWDATGARAGYFGRTDEEIFVFHQGSADQPFGLVDKASSAKFTVRTAGASVTPKGRAVRSGSRWILQRRVGGAWKTRGRVSTRASGWAAGAALWLLLW